MKKYKKNIIIAVSLFILILAAFFIWFNFYNYKFSLDNNGYLVYKGTVSSITVPSEINGKSVKLSDESFKGNKYLKKVILGEGITEIRGFSNCKNLKTVQLPESAYLLSFSAFSNCNSLTCINLDYIKKYEPNSLFSSKLDKFPEGFDSDKLNGSSFRDLTIKEIVIPECVKTIDGFAFCDVTTSKVMIPETVTHIGPQGGFDWIDGENYYVKEGSYAEQWMKDNGRTYHLYK